MRYLAPTTLDDAIQMLSGDPGDCRVLAGGTDLLVRLRSGGAEPDSILDIKRIDTLRRMDRRFPKQEFVWLMGSDNLAQFHRWKDWRGIARTMPIAVIARPGYDPMAVASPAMAWLRRYRVPAASFAKDRARSAPALTLLRFDPDPRSATAIRRERPDWAEQYQGATLRDPLTHRAVEGATAS